MDFSLYGCMTICLSIPPADKHLGYFQFGVIINKASINIYAQVLEWAYTLVSLE